MRRRGGRVGGAGQALFADVSDLVLDVLSDFVSVLEVESEESLLPSDDEDVLLEDAGLTEIENEGVHRIVRGGEAEARLNCATLQAFMARGILSQPEYAALQAVFFDPSFSFITRTIGVAWGKRAS